MRKILVTGSRDYTDKYIPYKILARILNKFHLNPENVLLIHGDCRGADKLAAQAAEDLGITPKPYPAKWDKHGKAAGPIRNQQMYDENPDIWIGIAFHEDLENSKGTKHMVNILEKNNIPWLHIK